MDCADSAELIHAYVDRELDLVRSLELERHLKDCRRCSEKYASLQALRSAVSGVYFHPPGSLEQRILSAVGKRSTRKVMPRAIDWRWIAAAASVVLMVVVSWSVARLFARPSSSELMTREVVSNHVRSLMANHLADVPSSDQHTVKPWFNGKLDFSPPVINLDADGFTLVGGRLDYLDGRAVAALVYQRKLHFINLFISPSASESDQSAHTATLQGYNVIHWSRSDMSWWAVSDLNQNELEEFANLIRSK
jgi:anti-sigma factor RsiW